MTEQQLDGANVGALFKQVDGEGVPQAVRGNRFRDFANALSVRTL